jgi:soluble cytochrome b562
MRKSLLGLLVAAGCLTAALATAGTAPADDPPSIKDVMGKLCKGPNAAIGQLKKALTDAPDWSAVKAQTALCAEFAPALAKSDPPKGEKADYEKLATAFCEKAIAIDKAADAKDLKAAKQAFEYLSTSCMGCHKGHKP